MTLLGHDPVGTMGVPGAPDQGLGPFLPPDEDDIDIEEPTNTAPDLVIGVHTQAGGQARLLDHLEAIAPTVLLE